MKRSNASLAGLTNKVQNPSGLPNLLVQCSQLISGGNEDSYKVVFSHGPKIHNEETYDKAVAECFDNKFRMIPATAEVVSTADQTRPLVGMIIAANKESLPYNEENVKNMKAIHANVMMDDQEQIWKVTGEGDSKRLVQTSEDDLEAILASRRARNVVTASYSLELGFENGDYLWFYDPNKYAVCAGFGMITEDKGPVALDRHHGDLVRLDPAAVIEAAPRDDLDQDHRPEFGIFETTASLNQNMAERHLQYMRQLYQGTDFFAKLDRLIRQRRQIGDDGNSDNTYDQVM